MNFEKELRNVLLDIIEYFQRGYDCILEEYNGGIGYDEDGEYEIFSKDKNEFKENEEDTIEYGTKKIMELIDKAGIK